MTWIGGLTTLFIYAATLMPSPWIGSVKQNGDALAFIDSGDGAGGIAVRCQGGKRDILVRFVAGLFQGHAGSERVVWVQVNRGQRRAVRGVVTSSTMLVLDWKPSPELFAELEEAVIIQVDVNGVDVPLIFQTLSRENSQTLVGKVNNACSGR